MKAISCKTAGVVFVSNRLKVGEGTDFRFSSAVRKPFSPTHLKNNGHEGAHAPPLGLSLCLANPHAMAQKLQQQLRELGSKLETPPSAKDSLVKLLKQAATCLAEVDQSPPKSILECMQKFLDAIVNPELVKHQDREVKLLVATCICEITRITAPEAPYSDDVLKEIFHLIVSTISGFTETSGPSFGRRVVILETLARYRSCVVMLDLECDDLVNEMFSTFFAVVSDEHPETVLTSMQTIMVVLLEESEEIREDLLLVLLSVLGRNRKDITKAARRLAMNVIEQCSVKLEPGIKQFLISAMSGDNRSLKCEIDYHEVIYDIYQCAPQILSGVVPYLTGELLTDQLDIRLKAVRLVGDLFSLPGSAISETFQPIFSEFLKRLTDRLVEVRMSVLEHVKICLLSNPFRPEAPEIISALCDRVLDYDENVRKQVVAVICDVACHALTSVPVETVKLVAERLRDKSLLVKKDTMERLADIYRIYCLKRSDGSIKGDEYGWITGKVLRCFYDKDFRSDTVEPVLSISFFPTEFSVKDKVKCWLNAFSGFDKVELKALEKILEQKQRLQQEMLRYLSLRQMYQDGDAPELQKKVLFCFRVMSHCFLDPAKAEENFQILDQFKDANVWKILATLLDPNTSSLDACSLRNDALKILGEKHRLYEFLSTLSVKCSYLLFNKEHVNEILQEVEVQKSAGNVAFTLSCMNILVLLSRFSPLLLSGIGKELVNLLEDDNEVIKEGVLHVLAKAGGTIREQLGDSSSSLDLILQRVCLEGSRRQAKYAVHAIAAITKDDGLKSLSVLYKRLVDMLEEKKNLPAVLQSLGCIAETAMPVFETRESEIEGFIKSKILQCSNKTEDGAKESWDDRSELCSLKIFGLKTLVKSYLPVKDVQLRLGIDELITILKNFLSFGEISKDIESSSVDKAHLKLAAAKAILRLSRHWEHKIPVDVIYLAFRTLEISFPQVKKSLLSKIHQYIKDRLLDPRYACAFLFGVGFAEPDFEEVKHYLSDIIQMLQQGKARQLPIQSDANPSVGYPEYILPYLVHALAHHLCPDVDECKDVKAYEPQYRLLHFFLSMVVHGDEHGKSEASDNTEKESISAVLSVFKSIKLSADTLDTTKSKNSYAICDLGLSITKRLASKPDDLQGNVESLSLPAVLYKPLEKEGDDSAVSEKQTWLADENALAHFESLKLEANGTVNSEVAEVEVLKDRGTDGNELPLGKMMKRLKAKGKKESKNQSLTGGDENEVDILKMVREINMDNLGVSNSKFGSSNGHDQKHKKRKPFVSESTDVPIPKRRRSSSTSKSHTKPSIDTTDMDDEDLHMGSEDENMNESAESDLLVSCLRKNSSFSPKGKGVSSVKSHNKADAIGETDNHNVKKSKKLVDIDSTEASMGKNSSSGKKRKRKSIAGLAKFTTKESKRPIMDLIGCRIKVWWPMDKQFYEGVVKSYDTHKMKHVILYDDGDVEVLRLDKERWELVENDRKRSKHLSSSKGGPSKVVLREEKTVSFGGSNEDKNLIKDISSSPTVRGKRTPRKNMKHIREASLKAESKGSPEISHPEPASMSKLDVDDPDSGGLPHHSEEEQIERVDKNQTSSDESDKVEKSVPEEKQVENTKNGSSDKEESKEEVKEANSEENHTDDDDDGSGADHNQRSDKEEEVEEELSHSEESEEEFDDENDSDSDSDQDNSKNINLGDVSEIPDDEPLSLWKLRVEKSLGRK